MNKFFALCALALVIMSCGNQKKEEASFFLEDFPNKWVQLTPEKDSYIISVPCEGNNPLLDLEFNEEKWWLVQYGPQDDYEFEVLSATEKGDTIMLNTKWKHSEDPLPDFKIVWVDKEKGITKWITSFSEGAVNENIYITADKQTNYPLIEQDCEEDLETEEE